MESTNSLKLTKASDIKPRRQKWAWKPDGEGIIPAGTATICAGQGGEGKTTLMLSLAAQLTRGTLPGDYHGRPADVLIVGPEDEWGAVMVPRLIAAGADLERVWNVAVTVEVNEYTGEREMRFPMDQKLMREAIESTGAKFVILDPAPALMSGDMNKVQDVRAAMGPLIALAQKYDLALILINHFAKGQASVSAKLSGSHAWRDAVRSFLAFATDEDTGQRVVTVDKNNYGTNLGSYSFSIESVNVETADGPVDVGRAVFGGASEVTVGQLLAAANPDAGDRSEVEEWLLGYLNREPWEFLRGDVVKAGRSEGFSEDRLKRAKASTGVTHARTNEVPAKTLWRHPSFEDGAQTVRAPYAPAPTALTAPTAESHGSRPALSAWAETQNPKSVHSAQSVHSEEPLEGAPTDCRLHPDPAPGSCYTCPLISERGAA